MQQHHCTKEVTKCLHKCEVIESLVVTRRLLRYNPSPEFKGKLAQTQTQGLLRLLDSPSLLTLKGYT
jgi:hypothetical protein